MQNKDTKVLIGPIIIEKILNYNKRKQSDTNNNIKKLCNLIIYEDIEAYITTDTLLHVYRLTKKTVQKNENSNFNNAKYSELISNFLQLFTVIEIQNCDIIAALKNTNIEFEESLYYELSRRYHIPNIIRLNMPSDDNSKEMTLNQFIKKFY